MISEWSRLPEITPKKGVRKLETGTLFASMGRSVNEVALDVDAGISVYTSSQTKPQGWKDR